MWFNPRDNDSITLNGGSRMTRWTDQFSAAYFEHNTRTAIPSTAHGTQTVLFDDGSGFDATLAGDALAKAFLNNASGVTIIVTGKSDEEASVGIQCLVNFATNGSGTKSRVALALSSSIRAEGARSNSDSEDNSLDGYGFPYSWTDEKFATYSATFDFTNTTLKIYKGGLLIHEDTSFATAGNIENLDSNQCHIGSDSVSNIFKGHMGDVFISKKVLDISTQRQLIAYFDQQSGRKTLIHEQFIIGGDSIYNGQTLAQKERFAYRLFLSIDDGSVFVGAKAVDGRTLNLMNTNITDITDSFAMGLTSGVRNTLLHNTGSNDINGGDTSATAQSEMQTFHDALKTSYPGCRIFWSTPIARTNEATTDNIEEFVADVKTNRQTLKIDGIALASSSTRFDSHLDVSDTNYYTDTVHLTALGTDELVTYAMYLYNETWAVQASVSYPRNDHVFQRQIPGNGKGNIRMEVEYYGYDSGSVEAQYNSSGYTQVSSGFTCGRNVAWLHDQTIADASVDIRRMAEPGSVTTITGVTFGTNIFQIGQSNNQPGFGTGGHAFSHATYVCRMFNDGEDTTADYNNFRTVNNSRSYRPSAGQDLVDAWGRNVCFYELAIGGTDQEEWQKTAPVLAEGYGFDTFETGLNLYNRFLRAWEIGGGGEFIHFYDSTNAVLQNNGIGGPLTPATYTTKMTQIADDIKTDTGVPMHLTKTHQITDGATPPGETFYDITAINGSIQDMWDANGNVHQGADFSDLSAAIEDEGDSLHIKKFETVETQGARFSATVLDDIPT